MVPAYSSWFFPSERTKFHPNRPSVALFSAPGRVRVSLFPSAGTVAAFLIWGVFRTTAIASATTGVVRLRNGEIVQIVQTGIGRNSVFSYTAFDGESFGARPAARQRNPGE